uniref:RNA-directed DNA polymerase n=1 Tax=Trichogramma kaykai TaxID=54128 RepID=A0ABD2W626_9HYME
MGDWQYFVNKFNEVFAGTQVKAMLYTNSLIVPPPQDRLQAIRDYHESSAAGHRGINATYKRLAQDFYWKNMRPDVDAYVKRCMACQTKKLVRQKTKLPLFSSDTPSKPFDKVSLDFYGPLKQTSKRNVYVLTMQCWFSKFVILTSCKKANAHEVARAMIDEVVSYFGAPLSIISDNGTHFQNNLLTELCTLFNIEKLKSCVYRPQTCGAIERMHATLTEYLKKFATDQAQWDDYLPLPQFAYNNTIHEATGFSPIEIVTGFRARMPTGFASTDNTYSYDSYLNDVTAELCRVQTLAAMNLNQVKYRSKYYYDQHINTQHFREGEMVMLLKEPRINKFSEEYTGPYEIKHVNHEEKSVILIRNGTERKAHIDKIKRAYAQKPTPLLQIDMNKDGDDGMKLRDKNMSNMSNI